MPLKKSPEQPLSLAQKKEIAEEAARTQRIQKFENQITTFVNEISDPRFDEVASAINRYLLQHDKRENYLKLEASLMALVTLLTITARLTNSEFPHQLILIPLSILLFHLYAQVEELGWLGDATSSLSLGMARERQAIVEWLKKLHIPTETHSVLGYNHLHQDLSDHQVITMVHEAIAGKQEMEQQALLNRLETGDATRIVNEDGELYFDDAGYSQNNS